MSTERPRIGSLWHLRKGAQDACAIVLGIEELPGTAGRYLVELEMSDRDGRTTPRPADAKPLWEKDTAFYEKWCPHRSRYDMLRDETFFDSVG